MQWERIGEFYWRCWTVDGWLVEYRNTEAANHPSNRGRNIGIEKSITFVPDPLKMWEI